VIQFRTYRCVFFILGFRFILKEISREELIPAFVAIVLLIFALLLTIFFTLYLGVESYYKQLMKQDGMPINFGLLCWDLVLCWYERNTVDETINNIPIIVFLIVIGIINRFWILDGVYKRSKCSEYHIYSVMSSINLIYTTTIGFLEVYEEANPRITFYPLLFLFFLLALSEYSYRRYLPQKNLFDVSIHIEEFLYLTQFIVEDLMKLNEDQKSNLHDTCILSFYYQHVKNCKIPDCNQTHEVVSNLLL
jgi:preprotein translocase subunit SecE